MESQTTTRKVNRSIMHSCSVYLLAEEALEGVGGAVDVLAVTEKHAKYHHRYLQTFPNSVSSIQIVYS
jgi:hypothetical protein